MWSVLFLGFPERSKLLLDFSLLSVLVLDFSLLSVLSLDFSLFPVLDLGFSLSSMLDLALSFWSTEFEDVSTDSVLSSATFSMLGNFSIADMNCLRCLRYSG